MQSVQRVGLIDIVGDPITLASVPSMRPENQAGWPRNSRLRLGPARGTRHRVPRPPTTVPRRTLHRHRRYLSDLTEYPWRWLQGLRWRCRQRCQTIFTITPPSLIFIIFFVCFLSHLIFICAGKVSVSVIYWPAPKFRLIISVSKVVDRAKMAYIIIHETATPSAADWNRLNSSIDSKLKAIIIESCEAAAFDATLVYFRGYGMSSASMEMENNVNGQSTSETAPCERRRARFG